MKCRAALAALLAGLLWTGTVMATEEPKFASLLKEDDFEIRRYAPLIVAETSVDGDLDSASSRGFQRLAGYIFGNNQRIAMTAPVVAEPQGSAEKIAMTVPVSLEAEGDAVMEIAGAQHWRMHFVMPSQYTLATLPRPLDPQVSLREVPAKTYAALTYSGSNTEGSTQERAKQLRDWLQARGIKAFGKPQLARYNPPWTLPFMRRNEILQEIAWEQP